MDIINNGSKINPNSSFEFFVKILSFLRKSKSSFTYLLVFDKRGFRRILSKSLRRLLGHIWPTAVGYSSKSFGSKDEMYSEPCSLITLEMILDLWILGIPCKLLNVFIFNLFVNYLLIMYRVHYNDRTVPPLSATCHDGAT